MPPAQQTPSASLTYTASVYDTVPGIASLLYAQTGYSNFSVLCADIMSANPQIADFTASLAGVTLLIPTVAAGAGGS